MSRWVIRGGEEAREVPRRGEAVWTAFLGAERWTEEAWEVALRGLLCGVAGEAGVGVDPDRSKERYPLSPRSLAQCCPALRFPPPEPRERRQLQGKWRGPGGSHSLPFLVPWDG